MTENCQNEHCCNDTQHCENEQPPKNGVQHPGVLDALGVDPQTGEVVLVMFEQRPWTGGDAQLFQLQEKVNAYLSFILDGELHEQLPQLQGKPLRITLACAEEPPAPVTGILTQVREQISLQGINLTVERLGAPQGGCGEGCGCA